MVKKVVAFFNWGPKSGYKLNIKKSKIDYTKPGVTDKKISVNEM